MAICEVSGVTRSYGEGATAVNAIKNISLKIEKGEFTAFCGPSGSGKTTLLNQIGCLDAPTSGAVIIDGVTTSGLSSMQLSDLRAQKIGFIFQSFNLLPVLTAVENVALAMELCGHPNTANDAARAILPKVGLGDLMHRKPSQLSGGQQQRVAIARALVKNPALVIADEPTANLDSETGDQVLELMAELNRLLGTTFLFSTHDPKVMKKALRIVTLKDGQVQSDVVNDRRAS